VLRCRPRELVALVRSPFQRIDLLQLCEVAMTEPTPITTLHISDIQFGHNHRFGRLALGDPDAAFDTLLARLTQDLDQLREDHGLKPDLLAVSGDLAEWVEVGIQRRAKVPREAGGTPGVGAGGGWSSCRGTTM